MLTWVSNVQLKYYNFKKNCFLGDILKNELIACLPIFLDRLKNEVTRLSAVKALIMIASSPLRIDLTPILQEIIPILGSFLRKNHRALRIQSLQLLNTIVENYSALYNPQLLQTAINEINPLLSDSDLHIAQLSLILLTSSARCQPQALMGGVHEQFLPAVLVLLKSPLLQGAALQCTLELFQALVRADLPNLSYSQILKKIVDPVLIQKNTEQLHKQAYHSLAKCVAALTVECPAEAVPLAVKLLQELRKTSNNDSQLVFCLLSIGEIGRHFDLSSIDQLPQTIIECFNSVSEDVKSAASLALGAVAVGNLTTYLPLILREIESQQKKQYLLLHSLKEVITSLSTTPSGLSQLLPSVPTIWDQLFKNCECQEEGSRNVIAECLGKLVLVNPEQLLPRLRSALKSPSALMRTTVVASIKFTISDQPQPIDSLLKQCIGEFLMALRDPEPSVRRVSLVAFNSAVHNKPSLVRELLPSMLPSLYEETKVNVSYLTIYFNNNLTILS